MEGGQSQLFAEERAGGQGKEPYCGAEKGDRRKGMSVVKAGKIACRNEESGKLSEDSQPLLTAQIKTHEQG